MKLKIGNTEIEGTPEEIKWAMNNIIIDSQKETKVNQENRFSTDSYEDNSINTQPANDTKPSDNYTKEDSYGHKDLIYKDYALEKENEK